MVGIDIAKKFTKESKRIVVKRRSKAASKKPDIGSTIKSGRWTDSERRIFIQGLTRFGRGKWKEIATMIPTRSTIQVKTHAQQVMKRADLGEDVYAEFQMQEGPSSTSSTQSTRTLQNDRQARVLHGFYVNTKSSSVSNTIIDALKEYDSLSQQDQGAAYILCQMAQPKALCRVL